MAGPKISEEDAAASSKSTFILYIEFLMNWIYKAKEVKCFSIIEYVVLNWGRIWLE